MRTEVTIAIPTFNRAEFLRDSLSSALAQDYGNVQVIVVDNASTDHTEQVVNELNDGRVRYIRQSENVGAYQNWRRCLLESDTDYFGWLQDDDVIYPTLVSSFARLLDSTTESVAVLGYALQVSSIDRIDRHNTRIWGPPGPVRWGTSVPTIVPRFGLIPWAAIRYIGFSPTALYRRKALISAYPESYDLSNPFTSLFSEFRIVSALSSIGPIFIAPSVYGNIRLHGSNESNLHGKLFSKGDPKVVKLQYAAARQTAVQEAASRLPASVDSVRKYFIDSVAGESQEAFTEYRRGLMQSSSSFDKEVLSWLNEASGYVEEVSGSSASKSITSRVLQSCKVGLKSVTPPIVWGGLTAIKDQLSK
jgi:glycosyltransferase involved in cell wall biosynthesis